MNQPLHMEMQATPLTAAPRLRGIKFLLASGIALNLLACSEPAKEQQAPAPIAANTQSSSPAGENSTLVAGYLELAKDSFTDLKKVSSQLHTDITLLLESPSQAHLENTHKSWALAHDVYQQTALFRNSAIPYEEFDKNQLDPVKHSMEIRIDQYPLLPGYLDSVPGYPASGLVNAEIELDEASLVEQHQFSDKEYVVLGFHALEFELWGSDEPDWQRSADDFKVDKKVTGEQAEAKRRVIERRREYLQLISSILLKDIEKLTSAWTSAAGHYPVYLKRLQSPAADQLIRQAILREQALLENAPQPSASTNPEDPRPHLGIDALTARKKLLEKLTGLATPAQTGSSNTPSQELPAQ